MKQRRRSGSAPTRKRGGGGAGPSAPFTALALPRRAVPLTEHECRWLCCALHNEATLRTQNGELVTHDDLLDFAFEVAKVQEKLTEPWAPDPLPPGWVDTWLHTGVREVYAGEGVGAPVPAAARPTRPEDVLL